MNDERFLIELSRHCFRLARICQDTGSAADFGTIGQLLLNRAHRSSPIASQNCAAATMPEGGPDPCMTCDKPCVIAPSAAKR